MKNGIVQLPKSTIEERWNTAESNLAYFIVCGIALTRVFLFLVQPLFSAELTILTENLPPLNYLKENVLVGPSVEIVK